MLCHAREFLNNKRFIEDRENVKAMMIVFFDIRSVIVIEWVPGGQAINLKYYFEVLTKLRERVRKKGPDLWKKK
jgi:hypothetical protein